MVYTLCMPITSIVFSVDKLCATRFSLQRWGPRKPSDGLTPLDINAGCPRDRLMQVQTKGKWIDETARQYERVLQKKGLA